MVVTELLFRTLPGGAEGDADPSHAIDSLLGAWRMGGQILGRELPIARAADGYRATLVCPELGALDRRHDSRYASSARAELALASLAQPELVRADDEIEGQEPCACAEPSSYILYTNYIALEPPLRCGACFDPVPLYRLPATYDGEYYNLICWESDYQSCDHLYMNSRTLERSTYRELSQLASALSQQSLEICRQIERLTGRPTYTFLMRHTGRSAAAERRRRCPGCGGEWLLDTPWHLFDFRCERCRLLSNIAWNTRSA